MPGKRLSSGATEIASSGRCRLGKPDLDARRDEGFLTRLSAPFSEAGVFRRGSGGGGFGGRTGRKSGGFVQAERSWRSGRAGAGR